MVLRVATLTLVAVVLMGGGFVLGRATQDTQKPERVVVKAKSYCETHNLAPECFR
jgi:hypothetical protein